LCLGDIDDIFNSRLMPLQLPHFHCSNKASKALKHMPIFKPDSSLFDLIPLNGPEWPRAII